MGHVVTMINNHYYKCNECGRAGNERWAIIGEMNERQNKALAELQRASSEVLDAEERLESAKANYVEALAAHHREIAADLEAWEATQLKRSAKAT